MKTLLSFLCFLFPACVSNLDWDASDFDADTVHIADGHHVKLMDLTKNKEFTLSKELKKKVPEPDYSKGIHSFGVHGVDLAMQGVPVLDQGQYGTCVTFSSTAALDALIGRGDFLSQQCSLELDSALGDNYWNGAYYPSQIIDPLQENGVVEKSKCPNQYANPYASISVDSYKALVDVPASAVMADVAYEYYPTASLDAVKVALKKGHRVLIGFQLQNVSQAVRGFDIKVDGQQYSGGLWACKQGSSKNYCASSNAGHEVLVIGYDDDQELLKIRNSWSEIVGEKGDYFMSYAYFSSQVMDQTEVW